MRAGTLSRRGCDHLVVDATIQLALLSARAEAERTIAALAGDLDAVVRASADANADDEHDPEGSTVAFERAQLAALLAAAHADLAEIDSALGRLDDGTYGRCEQCGAAIAAERLLARPAARQCFTCASRR
jgi:DnaK suppressor protein